MHMAFANAGGGDLHKLGLVLHLLDGGATTVAHAGAQATGHLVNDVDHGTLVGHATFNAFRHKLVRIRVAAAGFLEITVGASLLHGANRAHAAVTLVTAALKQNHFTGCLFGTGEHAAHHHRAGTGSNGFGNVTAEANATISNQGHTGAFECCGDTVNCHDLWHTDTGHDAGGANRARANADLDRIRTRLDQSERGGAGGDVAANHFHMRKILLDPAHPIDHAFAVAMCGVHHNGIHTGTGQQLDALFSALTYAHRRTHTQFALGIPRGIRKTGLFGDVFDGDQAFQLKRVVDHQKTLNFVLIQQDLGLREGGAIGHGHQLFTRRHDLAHRQVKTGLKAQIAPGHQTNHLATVNHGKPRHTELLGQRHHLAHRVLWRDHHRVTQHTRLVTLDFGHFGCLLLRRHVFMHDADAALLCNGNRQT